MTPTDAGRAEDSVPKKVMLFVSDMDTEYDNVFVTTSDNVGYKFSFAMRGGKRLLDAPDRIYMKPPVEKKEIETLPYVEFK